MYSYFNNPFSPTTCRKLNEAFMGNDLDPEDNSLTAEEPNDSIASSSSDDLPFLSRICSADYLAEEDEARDCFSALEQYEDKQSQEPFPSANQELNHFPELDLNNPFSLEGDVRDFFPDINVNNNNGNPFSEESDARDCFSALNTLESSPPTAASNKTSVDKPRTCFSEIGGNNTSEPVNFGSTDFSGGLESVSVANDASSSLRSTPEADVPRWVRSDTAGNLVFTCLWENCSVVLINKDELAFHISQHFEDHCSSTRHTSGWTCTIVGCTHQVQTSLAFRAHLSMHQYQAFLMLKGWNLLRSLSDFYYADRCGFPVNMHSNFDGKNLQCLWEGCGTRFGEVFSLFDHACRHVDLLEADERIDGKYLCRWGNCSQVCATRKNDMRRHVRFHSGEKSCACPFCGTMFSRSEKLYDHMKRKVAENLKQYTCMLCHKTFADEAILASHVRRHLSFCECDDCGLVLTSPSDLARHRATKHAENRVRKFSCTKCDKVFFSKADMEKHGSIHQPPQFQCTECDKMFRWKQQLTKHMRTHQDLPQKRYLCHLCSESYTTGSSLSRHLLKSHKFPAPDGFSKCLYKKCGDGMYRLQTKKLYRKRIKKNGGKNPEEEEEGSEETDENPEKNPEKGSV